MFFGISRFRVMQAKKQHKNSWALEVTRRVINYTQNKRSCSRSITCQMLPCMVCP